MEFDKDIYMNRRKQGQRGQDQVNKVVGRYTGGQAHAKKVGSKAVRKQSKRYRKAIERGTE